MEYITGYDVSIATYIVELIEEEISDDTRNSLKEYLTNLDLSIETINMMLDSLTEKNTTIEEGNRIYEFFMKEYELLGLGSILCETEKAKPIFHFIFTKKYINFEEVPSICKSIYDSIRTCSVDRFRNGIIVSLLKLIVDYQLVTRDLELSRDLATYVKSLNEEDHKGLLVIRDLKYSGV